MKRFLCITVAAITCWLTSAHTADLNQLKLNWGLSARQGKRPTMEDAHVASRCHDEPFFGLYDGHGGSEAAHIAAHGYRPDHGDGSEEIMWLNECLPLHMMLGTSSPNNSLVSLYQKAYAALDKTIQTLCTAGTTALTAHITNYYGQPWLLLAWAGDSRAVLIDNEGAVAIATKDHKPADPDELKRIKNEGGFVTMPGGFPPYLGCPRVGGILAVSRALGDKDIKKQAKGISAEPSIITCPLKQTHQALIMACDGVWDVISNEEAAQIVHQALHDNRLMLPTKRMTPDDIARANKEEIHEDGNNVGATLAARALRDAAYNKGSTDNISVMVIELH